MLIVLIEFIDDAYINYYTYLFSKAIVYDSVKDIAYDKRLYDLTFFLSSKSSESYTTMDKISLGLSAVPEILRNSSNCVIKQSFYKILETVIAYYHQPG